MVIAVFIGGMLIDKLGRKLLFTASCLGCGITLIVYACCYNYDWPSWIALICICLYLFLFGVALGPVPWYCIPELFPANLRSLGNSIVSTTNQLFTFVVIFIFPIMTGKKNPDTGKFSGGMGYMATCLLFASFSILGGLFGWFMITEPVKDMSSSILESNNQYQ